MHLFVDNLTVIDCSLLTSEKGITGESFNVDLILGGNLNDESMIFDFGLVKKAIKKIIDDEVDHKLVIPSHNKGLKVNDFGINQQIDFSYADSKHVFLNSPKQAFVFMDTDEITKDAIKQYLEEKILTQLPPNVTSIELNLHHEVIEGASFRYSHGLKKHYGNCQRIVHGHRSRIKIFQKSERQAHLEELWCERWENIYLGTEEDVVDLEMVSLSQTAHQQINGEYVIFSYIAPQGKFDLAILKNEVEILPVDTTIENISDYVANKVAQLHDLDNVKVHAYEGIGKGAISS